MRSHSCEEYLDVARKIVRIDTLGGSFDEDRFLPWLKHKTQSDDHLRRTSVMRGILRYMVQDKILADFSVSSSGKRKYKVGAKNERKLHVFGPTRTKPNWVKGAFGRSGEGNLSEFLPEIERIEQFLRIHSHRAIEPRSQASVEVENNGSSADTHPATPITAGTKRGRSMSDATDDSSSSDSLTPVSAHFDPLKANSPPLKRGSAGKEDTCRVAKLPSPDIKEGTIAAPHASKVIPKRVQVPRWILSGLIGLSVKYPDDNFEPIHNIGALHIKCHDCPERLFEVPYQRGELYNLNSHAESVAHAVRVMARIEKMGRTATITPLVKIRLENMEKLKVEGGAYITNLLVSCQNGSISKPPSTTPSVLTPPSLSPPLAQKVELGLHSVKPETHSPAQLKCPRSSNSPVATSGAPQSIGKALSDVVEGSRSPERNHQSKRIRLDVHDKDLEEMRKMTLDMAERIKVLEQANEKQAAQIEARGREDEDISEFMTTMARVTARQDEEIEQWTKQSNDMSGRVEWLERVAEKQYENIEALQKFKKCAEERIEDLTAESKRYDMQFERLMDKITELEKSNHQPSQKFMDLKTQASPHAARCETPVSH